MSTRRQERRAELAKMRELNEALQPTQRELSGLDDPEGKTRRTKALGLVKGETACNRSACQEPLGNERWFNKETRAFYCKSCAFKLNAVVSDLCTREVKW